MLGSELDSGVSEIWRTGSLQNRKLGNWEGMRVTKRWVEIEELDFFAELEALCDEIWEEVVNWDRLARETMGMQLVRAADSVGANLVEGDGRYSHKEALHFFYIARGSLREMRLWVRRAVRRKAMNAARGTNWLERIEKFLPTINALITTRRKWLNESKQR